MSRVSNELFLDSSTEVEIALACDPEYEPWSDELEGQFKKEFGDNAKETGEEAPF